MAWSGHLLICWWGLWWPFHLFTEPWDYSKTEDFWLAWVAAVILIFTWKMVKANQSSFPLRSSCASEYHVPVSWGDGFTLAMRNQLEQGINFQRELSLEVGYLEWSWTRWGRLCPVSSQTIIKCKQPWLGDVRNTSQPFMEMSLVLRGTYDWAAP